MPGFSPRYDRMLGEDEAHGARIGGSGSAQTLPMSEEEMASVVKRPLGFTAELPKRRKRKT